MSTQGVLKRIAFVPKGLAHSCNASGAETITYRNEYTKLFYRNRAYVNERVGLWTAENLGPR